MKLFKIEEISEEANEFDSFIRKHSVMNMGHVGSNFLATHSTYSESRVNKITRNFYQGILEGNTKIFNIDVVVEYLQWAKDNLEPKTWIYDKRAHINRINRYHRAFAYYSAIKIIVNNK